MEGPGEVKLWRPHGPRGDIDTAYTVSVSYGGGWGSTEQLIPLDARVCVCVFVCLSHEHLCCQCSVG